MVAVDILSAVLPFGLIALFVLANALFVAAEFSIILVPHPRIESRARAGDRQAPYILNILRNTEKRNDFIATAQIGITVASLGLGMYAEGKVAHWLFQSWEGSLPMSHRAIETLSFVTAVTCLTFIHVVVGEMVPQSMAVQIPVRVCLAVAGTMRVCEILLNPLARLLNDAGTPFVRMLGVPIKKDLGPTYSKEEILILIEESHEGGEIPKEDFVYLENIGDFGERTVGQVMTPRTQIVGMPLESSLQEVWRIIREHRKSRLVVYLEDLDNVQGILYYKTLARLSEDSAEHVDWIEHLRPPVLVPSTLPLNRMLKQFRSGRTSIAIVQDEFQSTDGLITMEDLLEEIFGEIQDETDRESPPWEVLGAGNILVQGNLLLGELEQHFNLRFDTEEVDTVGGLVMANLDRIPEVGDVVVCNQVEIRVVRIDNRAVTTASLKWGQAHWAS